ncbi:hypothetical protein HID58_054648 [Brassica napus]|uniref:Uncharacterized protein n=1 Tax=Brassica napus TaxID=3708 RepID=A0ABQ8AI70_BRANA|nr:hypothetical protein HID58_054648 [Brassica napus]
MDRNAAPVNPPSVAMPSYEGLENAIKQKEAETISKIESSRGRSLTVNRK